MFTRLFVSAITGTNCARHMLNGGAQKIKKHGEQGWWFIPGCCAGCSSDHDPRRRALAINNRYISLRSYRCAKLGDGPAGLCRAIRSAREEHITGEQREVFAALAPHVRTAVRAQLALEGQGAAVLTRAMDALSIPVFVCGRTGRTGRVGSLTQAAETLVSTGRGLQLKAGRLQACWPEETRALDDAIEAAIIWRAQPGPAVLRTVVVRGRDRNTAPLVLDVFPMPSQPYQFTFAPRVLVVARSPRGSKERRRAVLQATYALTSAESHIAEYLAEGHRGIHRSQARRCRRDRAYTDQSDHGQARRQPPGRARRAAWRVIGSVLSL